MRGGFVADCPFGLLINFNVPKLMDGVKRLVLPGHEWTAVCAGTRRESPMSGIRERDPPFLRSSVLNYSVVSVPSVVSGTELPQMMIEVLVLRHTPFRARHPSEEGVHVAVATPFSLRLQLTHDAEQALLHRGEVGLVLDHEVASS
jgi:hypothetical protein